MKKNVQWLIPVITCIMASVISLFLPVLTYIYPSNQKVSFNLFGFTEPSQDLLDILAAYSGPFEMYVDSIWLTVLAVLAALAIVAALVGVVTLSLQRANTWQFVLALVGMIGTAIPAMIVIIAVPVSQRFLPGTFRFGVYPIITPVAMVMSMITVTKKHKRTQAEIRAAEMAKDLMRPGGDL